MAFFPCERGWDEVEVEEEVVMGVCGDDGGELLVGEAG